VRVPRLTARERQVATLLRGGRANKQIAAQLRISEARVKQLVRQVCRKLAAANRAEAAAKWTDLEAERTAQDEPAEDDAPEPDPESDDDGEAE
jgi:DNA-binding NarL/FixJ family response regulator